MFALNWPPAVAPLRVQQQNLHGRFNGHFRSLIPANPGCHRQILLGRAAQSSTTRSGRNMTSRMRARPILAVSERTSSSESTEQQQREATKQQDGRGIPLIPPLIVAAEQGDTATMRTLLAVGAAPDQSDAVGRTALYAAATCDSRDAVSLFLDAGAAVDQPCMDGTTPLIGAALAGCTETVRLLLAAGANCSKSDESGLSPLHAAACAVQGETVSALIAAGATIDAVDACGSTPLHYAVMMGNEQATEVLLKADAGCDPIKYKANKAGQEPLAVALGEDNTDEIVALRHKLAMVAAKGQSKAEGLTALYTAPVVEERDLEWRRSEMVDLLLEHGATGGLIDVMNAFEKGNYDLADMVADTSMTGEDCEGYLLGAWKYKAYVLQEEVDKLRSELAAALKQQEGGK